MTKPTVIRMIITILWAMNIFYVNGEINEIKNTTYNAEELLLKIFNFSTPISGRQAQYGLIRFEDNPDTFVDDNKPYRLVTFEGPTENSFKFVDDQTGTQDIRQQPSQPLKFEEGSIEPNRQNLGEVQVYGFQDENSIEDQKPQKKKRRRRRRRKPRYQGYPYPGNGQGLPGTVPQSYPGYPGNGQGFPGQGYPGYPANGQGLPVSSQGYPGQSLPGPGGLGQYPYPFPGGQAGQFHRPPKRQKPSLASEALSAITGALTSIALYDDYQCVPRLLCEAAGGGALGSSSVLQNVAGLQPLLTLLAAYNGISTSPLFIFGRAVFLGMTAKGNLGTCRYAYPQCPTDPEQLVHYLNNHNGGFFRFFSSPQLPNPAYGQQNLQQFYNQLSVPQNYGLYQPNTQPPVQQNYGLQPYPEQENYGFYPGTNQQNYGLHQIPTGTQQGYGFPNLHSNNIRSQIYGSNYPHHNNYGLNRIRYKNNGDAKINEIQKRIQTQPVPGYVDDQVDNNDHNTKWLFPENIRNNFETDKHNVRLGKALKFPEEGVKPQPSVPNYEANYNRKEKVFTFPDKQNNIKYVNYYTIPTPANIYSNNFENNNHKYLVDNTNNNGGNKYPYDQYQYVGGIRYNNNNNFKGTVNSNNQNYNSYQNNDDGELETVYIVRGNGDPNNPEIVKVKPGDIIQ